MEGVKKDADKQRWDLLPLEPINEVVKVLNFGAKKYAPNNWQKVDNALDRYYAAAERHKFSYRTGEWLDKESGLPHLAHLLCCYIFIFWIELNNRKAYNGRYSK